MNISNENNASLAKPIFVKGGSEVGLGGRKSGTEIRQNRRPLCVINRNVAAAQPYPCLPTKTNGVCVKNAPIPAHRPVTRKFAAQMASSQQLCQEGVKRPKPSVEDFTVWEDIQLTDVEDHQHELSKDHPMPMSLEHSELALDEKNPMEEIEMEDIFEEPILDIDGCDANNQLAAVEYVEDLYAYYKRMEICSCVPPDYMENQCDINEKMRAILIDWLIEVHYKFELRDETLYLTVNIIDRFLAKQSVIRKKLQLVGLVAMLLACKYEEVSVPVVDDLVFISDKAYTRNEVLEMEKLVLSTLQFNMSVPTPYVFIKRFLKAAQSDKKLQHLSFFLIENCLVEYEMLKFPPSFLAASAVYTAQCTLYGFKQWNKTCEWYTSYTEDQLQECSKLIASLHQKSATGKLTAVHRKYNTSKFEFAVKCESAHCILSDTQK